MCRQSIRVCPFSFSNGMKKQLSHVSETILRRLVLNSGLQMSHTTRYKDLQGTTRLAQVGQQEIEIQGFVGDNTVGTSWSEIRSTDNYCSTHIFIKQYYFLEVAFEMHSGFRIIRGIIMSLLIFYLIL